MPLKMRRINWGYILIDFMCVISGKFSANKQNLKGPQNCNNTNIVKSGINTITPNPINMYYRCKGQETVLPLTESYVMVEQTKQPSITVQGKQLIEASVRDLKAGRRVFIDVNIHVDMNIQGDFVDEILDNDNSHVDDIEDNLNNFSYENKAHKLQLKLEKTLRLRKYR